jgi:hypothetical protein
MAWRSFGLLQATSCKAEYIPHCPRLYLATFAVTQPRKGSCTQNKCVRWWYNDMAPPIVTGRTRGSGYMSSFEKQRVVRLIDPWIPYIANPPNLMSVQGTISKNGRLEDLVEHCYCISAGPFPSLCPSPQLYPQGLGRGRRAPSHHEGRLRNQNERDVGLTGSVHGKVGSVLLLDQLSVILRTAYRVKTFREFKASVYWSSREYGGIGRSSIGE